MTTDFDTCDGPIIRAEDIDLTGAGKPAWYGLSLKERLALPPEDRITWLLARMTEASVAGDDHDFLWCQDRIRDLVRELTATAPE